MARPRKVIPDGDFQPDAINRKTRYVDGAGAATQTSPMSEEVMNTKAELKMNKDMAKKNLDEYMNSDNAKNPTTENELRQKQIDAEAKEYRYNNSKAVKKKKRI